MASLLNNGTEKTNSAFKNPTLRKLSGRGYDYKDSVIANSEAIGSIENQIGWNKNNNLLRYGYDHDSVDQLYDFSYSDVYSKKNIPFFDQSYPAKLQQLKRYSLQDEIEMILDTLTDEIIVFGSNNYFAQVKWDKDLDLKEEFAKTIESSLNENFKKIDRKSTRLNSSHPSRSRMPSSA